MPGEQLSHVMVHSIDELVYTLFVVLALGVLSLLISRKTRLSYVPIFILLGFAFGPILDLIDIPLARKIFDYVRVFGLVILLFAEGHRLRWYVLKKHLGTIITLDTVSLVITALVSGFFFSWIFHLPFLAGFLFGAIISATDPATLVPLFHQYKVREDIKVVLLTESIFNDPLGIVLTSVAIALLVPEAPSARFIEGLMNTLTLPGAAVAFFLYEVIVSIVIGGLVGVIGYLIIRYVGLEQNEEVFLFSLALAFFGFYIGEIVHASGYLVATTAGIILGNHHVFFKETSHDVMRMRSLIDIEVHFNEILATFAVVFIFILLGASVDPHILASTFIYASLVALAVVFVARPLATLLIIPLGKWSFKEYLFIALEGPRGVVPSALASLPLTLGLVYHNQQLVVWGEFILSTTLMTILISIILETTWLPILKKKLLGETGPEWEHEPGSNETPSF